MPKKTTKKDETDLAALSFEDAMRTGIANSLYNNGFGWKLQG